MKKWNAIGTGLLLALLLAGFTACNPLGEGEEVQQEVEVRRGDLLVTVSGSGNIEASEEANLTFGNSGRLETINIEKGDMVSEGQLLARLETDALELAEKRAEVALTEAQVSLTGTEVALIQAELARQTAERELDKTRDTEDKLELALLKARIDTRNAEHHVDETQDLYTWPDIETAQKDVDNAKAFLQYALDSDLPQLTIEYARARLEAAEAVLDAKINAYDTEEVAIAKLQAEAARKAETQAQKDLDELAEDIALQELKVEAARDSEEKARQSVGLAEQSVALARQSLNQARRNLEKSTVTAPFDGIITAVNAEEGDTITSATTFARIIDQNRLKLVIELDEIDVPKVKAGQKAVISLDAFPDTEFAGNVSTIFPAPKEAGGVVLYEVEVTLDIPEESGIRVGMSASADIILDERTDVLLVPDRAIHKDEQGNTFVNVVVDGETQERRVTPGISDGFDTEVVSGLSEEEKVIETRTVR